MKRNCILVYSTKNNLNRNFQTENNGEVFFGRRVKINATKVKVTVFSSVHSNVPGRTKCFSSDLQKHFRQQTKKELVICALLKVLTALCTYLIKI